MSELITHAARALPLAAETLSAVAGLVGLGGLVGLVAIFVAGGGRLNLTAWSLRRSD